MVSSVTPFPAVAWVRRILSPAVMTTCAWCSNRSTLALAMVLDISSSKPAGVFDALAAEALEACECAEQWQSGCFYEFSAGSRRQVRPPRARIMAIRLLLRVLRRGCEIGKQPIRGLLSSLL